MKIYNFIQIISSHAYRYTDELTKQIKNYEVMHCSLQTAVGSEK
jgi:hypothetical protein